MSVVSDCGFEGPEPPVGGVAGDGRLGEAQRVGAVGQHRPLGAVHGDVGEHAGGVGEVVGRQGVGDPHRGGDRARPVRTQDDVVLVGPPQRPPVLGRVLELGRVDEVAGDVGEGTVPPPVGQHRRHLGVGRPRHRLPGHEGVGHHLAQRRPLRGAGLDEPVHDRLGQHRDEVLAVGAQLGPLLVGVEVEPLHQVGRGDGLVVALDPDRAHHAEDAGQEGGAERDHAVDRLLAPPLPQPGRHLRRLGPVGEWCSRWRGAGAGRGRSGTATPAPRAACRASGWAVVQLSMES